MGVDPNCQALADEIEQLETQIAGLRSAVATIAVPQDRWSALAQIGGLNRQLNEKQRDLVACQRQHAAAYEADVAVFDTAQGAPTVRRARLWRMDGDAPVVVEEADVQSGRFAFKTHLDGVPLGITIAGDGAGANQGLDFRAGPLAELPRNGPADPAGRVEIVLGPPVTLSADDLMAWLAAVPLPQQTQIPVPTLPILGGAEATADVTLATLDAALYPDRIRIVGSGTARANGPLVGSLSAPFTLEVPITLGLPLTPDADRVCDVVVRGTPNLTVGGTLGSMLNPIMALLINFVAAASLPRLRDALNAQIPRAVAALFGLEQVPPHSVVTLREFTVTPSEITISAAIGAFGDVLSTFQP